MPNYTLSDILDNEENTQRLYGYSGKIIRINLSTKEISFFSTYKYVPKYVGGRMIINRIFWDEVKPGTKAFDEGNKFIYMTGPATGTGIPAGGRSAACGVGASSFPEQYSWGNIGGWFATELKFAGYDGFIIEGKSETPVYIMIDDDKIEILPADDLWGKRVHDSQAEIEKIHGHAFKSMVIGPAGENLVRFASITSGNDCVFAKGGFGAVWGSKNLKAITCHGTGSVCAADFEKLKYLRLNMNRPGMKPSPVLHLDKIGVPGGEFEAIYDRGNVACSPGCNQHCNALLINGLSAFSAERVNHIEKCVSICTFDYRQDIPTTIGMFWPTKQNYCAPCKLLGRDFPEPDFTDPDFEGQAKFILPDVYNFWQPDYDRGTLVNDLCNEYGIDKWEIVIWLSTWLSMCQKEGLFEKHGIDFGMPVDVDSAPFMFHIIHMLVYREGELGNLLAEGMARTIRKLGKDEFGDTIYHERFSNELGGERIDIPVSLEAAWGHSVHWQGRGFEGAIDKPTWLGMNIINMLSTRDAQTVEHYHCKYEYHDAALKDPYHCMHIIDAVNHTQNCAEIKDAVPCCEWQSPDLWWPSMESEIYTCATGYEMDPEELEDAAFRSKLLFRAILIRNFGRTRQLEMQSIWHLLQVPDSWNDVADWKSWNEFVDLYYESRGWDLETGWPYRETYEKYGLKDVADEMEKLGFLPERPAKRWCDYGEPPVLKFVENRKAEMLGEAQELVAKIADVIGADGSKLSLSKEAESLLEKMQEEFSGTNELRQDSDSPLKHIRKLAEDAGVLLSPTTCS